MGTTEAKLITYTKMTTETIKSAAQARGFYDAPLYEEGQEKPDYYNLFSWSPWNSNSNLDVGILKEELFDTIDKKVAYLQGVFEDSSEGWGIIRGQNSIHFANSSFKTERCKKWINEIARLTPDAWSKGVVKHTIEYSTPICHQVDINPRVVEFIQNYKPLCT